MAGGCLCTGQRWDNSAHSQLFSFLGSGVFRAIGRIFKEEGILGFFVYVSCCLNTFSHSLKALMALLTALPAPAETLSDQGTPTIKSVPLTSSLTIKFTPDLIFNQTFRARRKLHFFLPFFSLGASLCLSEGPFKAFVCATGTKIKCNNEIPC